VRNYHRHPVRKRPSGAGADDGAFGHHAKRAFPLSRIYKERGKREHARQAA